MTHLGGSSNMGKGLRLGFTAMLSLGACDVIRFTPPGFFQKAAKSLDQESDLTLAREAAPGLIKTIDGMVIVSPHNELLLELTAQAYCSYSFGFLEDDLEAL